MLMIYENLSNILGFFHDPRTGNPELNQPVFHGIREKGFCGHRGSGHEVWPKFLAKQVMLVETFFEAISFAEKSNPILRSDEIPG